MIINLKIFLIQNQHYPCKEVYDYIRLPSSTTLSWIAAKIEKRLFGCLTTSNKYIYFNFYTDNFENSDQITLFDLGCRKEDFIYEIYVIVPHMLLSIALIQNS